MNYIQQMSVALDKEAENVAFLAYFPDAKLESKLTLVRSQMATAKKNNQTDALELLKVWEEQILDAQVLKHEFHLDDNPLLDIQMHLPELEAFEMIEKRQEILRKKLLKEDKTVKESNTTKFL